MQRGRRRRLAGVGAALVAAGAWSPVLVAEHYADGPGGAEVGWLRIDRGWDFLVQAARDSRGPELGTDEFTLQRAQTLWAGPPAVARDVRLTWLPDRPFGAPVPAGGTPPGPARRVVRPRSRLGWVVTGPVRGGPSQMIGLLDYASGRVAWDIRPFPAEVVG